MDYPKSVPGVGLVNGKFVDEDANAGTVGSIIPSAWGNAVTDEILAACLLLLGAAPDEAKKTQLRDAIVAVARGLSPSTTVADTGAVNAIVADLSPAPQALENGMRVRAKIKVTGTGPATFNLNGTGAKQVVGRNHQALQGGELFANGHADFELNTALNAGAGAWILLGCAGAAFQVGPASQSGHAVAQSQVIGLGQTWQNMTASRAQGTTYTNTTGKPIALSICSGTAASSGVALTVGGLSVASSLIQLAGGSFVANVFSIVPPGVTYSVPSWNTGSWFELR